MAGANPELDRLAKQDYKYGFVTDIEEDRAPPGLTEDVVRLISSKKNEPEWLLEYRLKAFRRFREMLEDETANPDWAKVDYPEIDYDDIVYYSAPKQQKKIESLDELDPELRETYDKLGISLLEQKRLNGIAVDAVFDSVSVATTFKDELEKQGIIFCSFSEAVAKIIPSWSKKYLGSCGPLLRITTLPRLNCGGLFSDGSFCVRARKGYAARWSCRPISASMPRDTGQFERTLLIADEGAYVSYLEGCTAPQRDENQLHAAVVELDRTRQGRPDQVFDRPELVPPATRMASVGSTTSSPSAAPAAATSRRSPGPRSKPARPSRGNTLRAC